MRYLAGLLLLSLLGGCIGGKPKPAPAVYDFGLELAPETPADAKVRIDAITAAEPLNSNRIRYRLNYQNPAQVFTYTESRWAAQPAELLMAKTRGSAAMSGKSSCVLQLQLEAFDHVFDSPTASFGVVQLNAVLKDKSPRKLLAHKQFHEQATAASADARGGAMALNQASTAALAKAIDWAGKAAAADENCH
jgi:cholesterol transport system auxiliary component